MAENEETNVKITAFRHEHKWLLGVGVHMIGITAVAAAFWSHVDAKWGSLEMGTQFETEAAARVYRRGNLQRMILALKDNPI